MMTVGYIIGLVMFGLGCGIMLMAWAERSHRSHLAAQDRFLVGIMDDRFRFDMDYSSHTGAKDVTDDVRRLIDSAYTK